jgi:hypothetical protein
MSLTHGLHRALQQQPNAMYSMTTNDTIAPLAALKGLDFTALLQGDLPRATYSVIGTAVVLVVLIGGHSVI